MLKSRSDLIYSFFLLCRCTLLLDSLSAFEVRLPADTLVKIFGELPVQPDDRTTELKHILVDTGKSFIDFAMGAKHRIVQHASLQYHGVEIAL